ncbi:MAG: type II toxin-antitoxin system Phd/YefM family antitoxin [Planctomycetes bacterium]|nr:type II toxin-antitoxin system Phd/YefM family antitoxin [Planctomycetota bacterium]
MALSLVEDVKTVSELKRNLRAVFLQIHQTGRPVVVTVNGKPDMVLLDAALFERKLRTVNLAALLAVGEEDVRCRRTKSARSVFEDLRRGRKVSR